MDTVDEAIIKQTQQYLSNDVKTQKIAQELIENNRIMIKYSELVAEICKMLKKIPKEKRNSIIERKFPENITEIKDFLRLLD